MYFLNIFQAFFSLNWTTFGFQRKKGQNPTWSDLNFFVRKIIEDYIEKKSPSLFCKNLTILDLLLKSKIFVSFPPPPAPSNLRPHTKLPQNYRQLLYSPPLNKFQGKGKAIDFKIAQQYPFDYTIDKIYNTKFEILLIHIKRKHIKGRMHET